MDESPFRPPRTSGNHPNLDCVQGMVPLLPVTQETGGLEVVPCTHVGSKKEGIKKRYPKWKDGKDFCVLDKADPLQTEERVLLLAEPGDLILWDARTVHGGRIGTRPAGTAHAVAEVAELARMSVTVAMTPRALATPETEKERRKGFLRGRPFTHRPHGETHGGQCPGQFPVDALPTLNATERPLLGDVPASPKDVFKHYATSFTPNGAGCRQRALALSDWAAGAWAGARAAEEVLLGGMEHWPQDDAPAVTVGLLVELLAAGLLTAADVADGLGQLQAMDLVEARLDFPKVDDYIARVVVEARAHGLG